MKSTARQDDEGRLLDLIHRHVGGAVCAVCGVSGRLVATRLIEYTGSRGRAVPEGFVLHSGGTEMVSGGLAVCDECSPPCRLCQLPAVTSHVMKFYKAKEAELSRKGGMLEWGEGRCRHSSLRRALGL